MAELTHSHYGDLRGTVGGITFAQRKGKIIVKKKSKEKSGEPTPKQILHKEKFIKTVALSRTFKEMIGLGVEKANLGSMSGSNMFYKQNLKNLSGTLGALVWEYSKINLGPGRLLPPASVTNAVAGSTITLNWSTDAGGDPLDNIHIAAYNPTLDLVHVAPAPSPRSSGTGSISVPSAWTGHQVHTYLFARNENKNVSSTVYGGDVTIT